MLTTHPSVPHPFRDLKPTTNWFHTWASRVVTSVLGSMAVFWVTFLVPLVVIPASDDVKLIAGIIFSSWFQAWALPILQRSATAADVKRDAKADADHMALTAIAVKLDALYAATVIQKHHL